MKKILLSLFAILVLLAVPFQLWLEAHHYSDSLGFLYTIYCSLIYAGLLTVAFAPIMYMLRRHKPKISGGKVLRQK